MIPEQLAIEWRALRRFTPDKDVAAVRDYIDRAFEYAKRLPSSIDSLAAAIQANKIGDHEVWFYLGHSVKGASLRSMDAFGPQRHGKGGGAGIFRVFRGFRG